jgi:antitoxin HicB
MLPSLDRTVTYTVVLERDQDAGGFVATCPALPGLVTEGQTVEETFDMARDAIRGYLESLEMDGFPIPEEREPVVSPITVHLARV